MSLCDYCDFYSEKLPSSLFPSPFLNALITDIKYQIDYFGIKEIPTVYIGGGTPSVLGEEISVLFKELKAIPSFSPVEFTVEANPESLSEGFLRACVAGGVNRLSLGVQTFCEDSRLAVNRWGVEKNFTRRHGGRGGHGGSWGIDQRRFLAVTFTERALASEGSPLKAQRRRGRGGRGELLESLSLASRYFPDSLSVDLIVGLPFQDLGGVLDDVKRVLEFKPAFVSLYSLTVEDGTPLYEKLKNKIVTIPEPEVSDSMWLVGRDALLKAGFEHYEVSNFALPGKRCLHNLRYWRMESWIGAGPAASGTVVCEESGTAKRFTYPADVEKYVGEQLAINNEQLAMNREKGEGRREEGGGGREQFGICDCEVLDRMAFLKECLLMGFRCVEGPDPVLFKRRFGVSVEECIPRTLSRWEGKDKMLFLNGFLAEAFEEVETMDKVFKI